MKSSLVCTVFSDGSLVITTYSGFSFSGPYKILTQDINNNTFWSGSGSEHQTEIASFTSRFDLPQNNS